jgi:hypothetical protein
VRKAHHRLFDAAIIAEGLRQRGDFQIQRDVRQEFIGVELMRGRSTYSPYAGRNDEHIRMLGYRREGRIGIFEHEFGVGVLLPGRQHLLLIGR